MRLERGVHRHVFRQALLQASRRVQLLQARELDDLAQIADHLRQPAVVGQQDDGFVDREVGFVVFGDALAFGVALQAVVQLLQRSQVGVGGIARGLESAAPFQQCDDWKNFVQILLGDLAHKATPARFMAQQALGRQHLERLSQRCSRDGQLGAQRGLIDETAGHQCTRKNPVAQLRSHFIVQRVGHQSHL
ncbi:hypothetical protein Y695_02754 [Hydrogenophaga sp. T4]|nr:hypothetical protein Y695_02754 [Hydrogenophaga sp. T4]